MGFKVKKMSDSKFGLGLGGHAPLMALLLALGATTWSSAASVTEPAQIPLSSRVAEPPIPNVLLTVDDSGSMLADFMPEGDFTLNGKTVNLSSNWVGGFPGDLRKLNNPNDVNDHPFPVGNYLVGVVTAEKGNADGIYQMQFRSPDVNFVWYNPDIRYDPWFKPDGSGRMAPATAATARWDPVVSTGTFDLTTNVKYGDNKTRWYTSRTATSTNGRWFYPGLVYRLNKSGDDPTATANYTRYDVNAKDGSHAPKKKHDNRTDCVSTKDKCTQAEELQNFANWFTYYRMRESLTKAAVAESFVAFKDKLRVGWGRINNSSSVAIDGSTTKFSVIEAEAKGGPMRPLDGTRLSKVLTGVQGVTSWPSTPLRTALNVVGSYFDRSGDQKGSPWKTDPTKNSSEKLTCRRSVSLLMTDGYYNDTFTGSGDVDGVDGPDYSAKTKNPNGYSPTQYKAARPFIDAPNALSNTLADVASKYFVKDLDTTISNKVPPVTGDIAYWQHMTQFMVGLGVSGTLDSSTPAKKTATIKALTDGTKSWPAPVDANPPTKIDDMWHAAVNTGGDFYSVRNVTELTAALKDAFGKSAGAEAKEAGVATSSAYVVAGNVKYVPKYKSVSWWGDLEAWPLGVDGREGDSVLWRSSENMPKHADRNLFVWSDWSNSRAAVPFKWESMGSLNQGLVGSENLANYVRGDESKTGYGESFRARDPKVAGTAPLGDLVNSPPVLVKGLTDLGYDAFDTSYAAFVQAKKARTDGLIFVGGNDGIAHAFRSYDGKEVFGYLPREGLSNLHTIAATDYGTTSNYHRFFVDGPVNETDAFIKPPGASAKEWTNLVIGSMGAGGKTFFALHVPNKPQGAQFAPSDLGANTLVWEISGSTDPDVGYMFSDFAVGKIKGGGWKAFVGNGVYSTNGKAVLLVVDMETGQINHRIVVDNGSGTGLMGVSLIKDSTTQEVLGAYAGDLKGNLWRFDAASDTDIKVGFSGKPLFRATGPSGNVQPITIAPSMVVHPDEGQVVLFGTGRLIDEADSDSNASQTFYGVWDPTKLGESSVPLISPFELISVDRSKLQAQTTTTTPVDGVDGKYFEVVSTKVNWETKLGWFMDLPFERQRVIFPSFVLAGAYVLINTSVPATQAAVCTTSSGVGYNYVLAAADGMAQTESATFDTNGDGVIDDSDIVAAGVATGNDGRDAILKKGSDSDPNGGEGEGGDPPCVNGWMTYLDCSTGKQCQPFRLECSPKTKNLKDRLWKQILNPPVPN
jgi:type IV pilus assembly protein PilY1